METGLYRVSYRSQHWKLFLTFFSTILNLVVDHPSVHGDTVLILDEVCQPNLYVDGGGGHNDDAYIQIIGMIDAAF